MQNYKELPTYKYVVDTLDNRIKTFPYGTSEHLSLFMTKRFFEQEMMKIVYEAIDEYKKWVVEESNKNPFE